MQQYLTDSIALLSRTPAALSALLLNLPDSWRHSNEGVNTWSVFDVIAHLNHCERTDWMPRVRMILESGETRTFPPLDRSGHAEHSRGKSLPQLLDEFVHLRTQNLIELRALDLQPGQLGLRGRHPAFGSVTLSQLLATWPAHDLTHLHQISRIMAHQYRKAVGPWQQYLGVLQCQGHSAPA